MGRFEELCNLGDHTGFRGKKWDLNSSDTSSSDSFDDEDESDYEGGRNARLSVKQVLRKVVAERERRKNRQLAILRTNRQIYNKASALLHSNLVINIGPGDVLTGTSGNDIVEPSKRI